MDNTHRHDPSKPAGAPLQDIIVCQNRLIWDLEDDEEYDDDPTAGFIYPQDR